MTGQCSFCYLGDTLDGDGGADLAVTARIRNGWMKYQGRKLSTATAASAIDALQLAEVPLKIYLYSRPMWPGPPGRGAPLGFSEKLSS